MEALEASPENNLEEKLEFNNIGDPIKIDISVIKDIINKSSKITLEKQEDLLFLFGLIDAEGYICMHKCLNESELSCLANKDAQSRIMSGICQMAYSFGTMRKMVYCFLHISQNEMIVSNEFLMQEHSECISLRNRLNSLPIPVSCIFGNGTLDSFSKKQPIRFFLVDKNGIFNFNGIEIIRTAIPEVIERIDKRIPEIIINEGKGAKS